MALRGRVGNSVVARLLKEERHVHGAGCGHGGIEDSDPKAQSALVKAAIDSPSSEIPDPLRTKAESFYGTDFTPARLHDGPVAQRAIKAMGAEAMTIGHHVFLPPSGSRSMALIGHEFSHLNNNLQGVPETGIDNGAGTPVTDPDQPSERTADTEGHAFATHASPAPTVQRAVAEGTDQPLPDPAAPDQPAHSVSPAPLAGGQQAPRATGGTVQRTVTMNVNSRGRGADFMEIAEAAGKDKDLDQLLAFLLRQADQEGNPAALSDEEKSTIQKNEATIKSQLGKWVAGTPGIRYEKSHPDFGSKQQSRVYNTYTDFARGLLGWVESKENRHREKELAQHVKEDSDVEFRLETLCIRIRHWVLGEESSTPDTEKAKWAGVRRELESGRSDYPDPDGQREIGHYQKYFDRVIQENKDISEEVRHNLRTGIKGGMWKVLVDPEKFTFRDKMIVLHDLMEYFGHPRDWNAPFWGNNTVNDQPEHQLTTTAIDDQGNRTAVTSDRGQERTPLQGGDEVSQPSTRRESAQSTRLARQHRIPVWAGSSFTAARMLHLAQRVGGSLDELSAVAWGTFAFWRLDYDHTSRLAYHPLHEVMDIAQNFGIPYNLLDREKDLQRHAPGTVKRELLSSIDSVTSMLEEATQEMDACISEVTKRLQEDEKLRFADSDHVLASLRELAARIEKVRAEVNSFRMQTADMAVAPGPDGRKALRHQLGELPKVTASLTEIHGEIDIRRQETEILLKNLEAPAGEASRSRHDDTAIPHAPGFEEVVVKSKPKTKKKKKTK
ncbi:DUF4157 domain-containing protein [Streptomyces sp. BPTC-684]|uniref:eCIS core domain-containing protein n=1 Tax=Streptomyces sp. BPTC-684 TaxID=3043734 RepID=UPI0024B1B055|nr:DUF4157 domain-containing protein [Streptomyces sp. BPTC-684]WHM40801.1 DUF4157 domain-containing protein [Streptomyces sp. BPTC-684]